MGRTDSRVMAALRSKLAKPGEPPVSPQAVQQRRAKLQAQVPMSSDIATYVVAQRAGVPLHKFLDAATLDQVAGAEQRLSAKESSLPTSALPTSAARKSPSEAPVVKELKLEGLKVPAAALSVSRMTEAHRMATVYATLYAFENSLREFIDGHLTAVLGRDWWDNPKVVSGGIRATVERNRAAEGKHRYHSTRRARPIYYTNVGDLATITISEQGWKIFKGLFPSDKWLPGLVEKVEVSRNVVAHMNPLHKRDIDRIRLNFEDWLAQIKGHEPAVP